MNRTESFFADEVELDAQTGFVGFANTELERYFWMQPDEMSNSKDRIWLERDDQQWGGTGDDWKVCLSRKQFVVKCKHLDYMFCDAIEIDFDIDDKTYAKLVKVLQEDMKECSDDLVIAK